jgi:hypothetical protein
MSKSKLNREEVADLARRASAGDAEAKSEFAKQVSAASGGFRGPGPGRPGKNIDKAIEAWAAVVA